MAYRELEQLLKRTIGLDPVSIGSASIERAVQSRMRACHLKSAQEYLEHLRLSVTELQELFDAVIVPETWFFRDREAFAAMIHLLYTEWLPKHQTDTVRLLSLPCSTGEEPYSIAMSLLDAGFSPDRVRIDAMDISTQSLALARRAIYGKNAFRGRDITFQDRYFEAKPQGYHLAETIRSRVNFDYGNLLDPRLLSRAESYECIYCRNLLIYFDADTQKQAVQMLTRLLVPGGYLFLGPSETTLPPRDEYVSLKIPMAFAFRKEKSVSQVTQQEVARRVRRLPSVNFSVASIASPVPVPSHARPHTPRKAASHSHPLPALPQPVPQARPEARLDEAQRLADRGALTEAAEFCRSHLREFGPSARAYYLLGLVQDADGKRSEAAAAYRRALYLDPNHDETLVHLALLLEQQHDPAGAKVLYDRARRAASERMSER